MNRIRTVLIALALLPTCLVVPARAENVVRWATPMPADSFDPYGHDELFTIWVNNLVFESLINYDWQGRLEPGLAVSWKRLDAPTWEMELRQGVTFHDGTPFTSADVVFSIERAKAETSSHEGRRERHRRGRGGRCRHRSIHGRDRQPDPLGGSGLASHHVEGLGGAPRRGAAIAAGR